ncbi:hypothetical protein BDV93DRAFT_528535 [Ceratobasidium sp. AG-I]|nr:hypothetical protein BDV93DRAFT_528535 [Ceratobasidium sp. AG-I]
MFALPATGASRAEHVVEKDTSLPVLNPPLRCRQTSSLDFFPSSLPCPSPTPATYSLLHGAPLNEGLTPKAPIHRKYRRSHPERARSSFLLLRPLSSLIALVSLVRSRIPS